MISDQSYQDLQRRVLQMEARLAFLYNHLGVEFNPTAAPGDDPRVVEQIQKGNMLGAIKIYRELTESNFEDAKRAVEDMVQRLGI